jgi:hypothetical protein
MAVQTPSASEIRALARRFGLEPDAAEVEPDFDSW